MGRVLRALVHAIRILSGRNAARRGLTVFRDDVFIVSYPKSGNTWTRFLIGNLVHQSDPVTFANIEQIIPSIYVHPDRVLRRLPRILKSHEAFDPRYQRVIYIVRDPRDVAVSYYYYCLKHRWIPEATTLADFIPRFMAPEFEVEFGTWADNVLSWILMRRHSTDFLLLHYEEMLKQPQIELAKLAHFLNIEPTIERLNLALNLSSADRMRHLEKKEGDNWALTKGTRKDVPFVRTATAGGWRKVLRPEVVAEMEKTWGNAMDLVGYQLSSRSSALQQSTTTETKRVSSDKPFAT
jgi:sulfotransferase family protein